MYPRAYTKRNSSVYQKLLARSYMTCKIFAQTLGDRAKTTRKLLPCKTTMQKILQD